METKDLILRNWQENDASALYEMSLDANFRKSGLVIFDSVIDSHTAIKHWMNNETFLAIARKTDNSFLGFVSLGDMNRYDGYMELEYAIAAPYRNKGYAVQAINRMLDYGFQELNLLAIAAWVRSHNDASTHVLEKCLFTFEGRLRRHARDKSDTLCYSMLKEEWKILHNRS